MRTFQSNLVVWSDSICYFCPLSRESVHRLDGSSGFVSPIRLQPSQGSTGSICCLFHTHAAGRIQLLTGSCTDPLLGSLQGFSWRPPWVLCYETLQKTSYNMAANWWKKIPTKEKGLARPMSQPLTTWSWKWHPITSAMLDSLEVTCKIREHYLNTWISGGRSHWVISEPAPTVYAWKFLLL